MITEKQKNANFDEIVGQKKYNKSNFSDLQTGDVLFFSGNYLFSKGTQLLSNSTWNHIALVVNFNNLFGSSIFNGVPKKNGDFIIENHSPYFMLESVIPNGIRLMNFAKAGYRYENGEKYDGRIAVARLNKEKPFDFNAKFINYLFSAMGERYATEDLLGLALSSFLATYTEENLTIKENPVPPFVCSELVYYLIDYVYGYELNSEDGLLTPSLFAKDPAIEFLGEIDFNLL